MLQLLLCEITLLSDYGLDFIRRIKYGKGIINCVWELAAELDLAVLTPLLN